MQELTQDELEIGLLLTDPLLFTKWFWHRDLTIPPHRLDLPEMWRGKQVISLEQRLMFLDGAMYFLFRDTMPGEAGRSSQKVCVRTGRKIAKTIAFEARYIQAPIVQTRVGVTEGIFHAPGDAHLSPVLKRIDTMVDRTPLFRIMHRKRNRATHIDEWRSGESVRIWHRRIAGTSGTGRNFIGLRAYDDLGDEGDYSNEGAFEELQQTDLPEAFVFWAGVPHGVRGPFWAIARSARGKDWSRHVQGEQPHLSYDMRANPLYHSQEAWKDVMGNDDYSSHRIQTQVLGRDGQEARSTFPVIPVDPKLPFTSARFRAKDMVDAAYMERLLSRLPVEEVEGDHRWIIHCDYGFSPSPMVVGVSYELVPYVWVEFARFVLRGMDSVLAAQFLHVLNMRLSQPAVILCLDAHGRGAGTLENLQKQEEFEGYGYAERVIPAAFETSTPDSRVMVHKKCRQAVRFLGAGHGWTCDTCHEWIIHEDDLRPTMRQSKIFLTDDLAEALANGQRWLDEGIPSMSHAVVLARDEGLIQELQGTTTMGPSGHERFVPPDKKGGHTTDAWLALMRALRRLQDIEQGEEGGGIDELGWA